MKKWNIYQKNSGEIDAVKEGFNWWAFFFPGLWAFSKDLKWAGAIGLSFALAAYRTTNPIVANIFVFVPMLIYGFMGNGWVAAKLEKKGYSHAKKTEAASAEGAKEKFHEESGPSHDLQRQHGELSGNGGTTNHQAPMQQPELTPKPVKLPADNEKFTPIEKKDEAIDLARYKQAAEKIETSSTSPQGQHTEYLENWAYEQVGKELDSNNPEKGTWTKAFAQAGGDDKQTRVFYIKARVEKLIAMQHTRLEYLRRSQEESARLEDLRKSQEESARLAAEQPEQRARREEARQLAISDEGDNFLNYCCWGFIDKVKEAVNKKPLLLAIVNSGGNTALHLAVIAKQHDIAKFLVEKGASVDARNNEGKTPIDLARSNGMAEIVKLQQPA